MTQDRTAAITGGGPAGLMAAETLRRAKIAVTVYERMPSLARKLLMAGRGDAFMLKAKPDLFVAGEMLDWEAPTGGYLVQACFATGLAAGEGTARHLASLRAVEPA